MLFNIKNINSFYHLLEASGSEFEGDNDRGDAVEGRGKSQMKRIMCFFDTQDFLSSCSFKSIGSDMRSSSFSSYDEYFLYNDPKIDPSIKAVGANFPHIERQNKLPGPVEKENGVSMWSMIKDNIGNDLTKVCLPIYFNEPIYSLQKYLTRIP